MSKNNTLDGLDNKDIFHIVDEIRAKIDKGETISESDDNYAQFKDRYPTLYDMACNKVFDYDTFKYMMSMRQKIVDGTETVQSSSEKIGKEFFDKYHSKCI